MIPKAAAIIPAAGSGSRMNTSCPKQYLQLAGKPIVIHSISAFHQHPDIAQIVVVVPEKRVDSTRDLLEKWNLSQQTTVVAGGKRRQDSVKAGLDYLDANVEIVLVHDGARPLVTGELISNCCQAALEHGACVAAIPVKDTLKQATKDNTISVTVNRANLWQAQTPQAAQVELLRQAYDKVGSHSVTDEASLLELSGVKVTIVNGSEMNIKVTYPEDLLMADKLMQASGSPGKIGHGFDAHRFAPARALVLGGINIKHDMGLAGHSDADVVTHALCDAILGALGKGDIGKHFPDSKKDFKDIYSIQLLKRVVATMCEQGYILGNADITVVCQLPKLAPYIAQMINKLADTCRVAPEQLNIKATTTEKMGFTGRNEGISCHAVVFLRSYSGEISLITSVD